MTSLIQSCFDAKPGRSLTMWVMKERANPLNSWGHIIIKANAVKREPARLNDRQIGSIAPHRDEAAQASQRFS